MSTHADLSVTRIKQLFIVIGSAFVLWHSIVLLIGCAPPSYIRSKIYPVFARYIELLHLDGHWAFFAPDPSSGRLLRYTIEDAEGKHHAFRFSESLRRGDPAYLRYTTLSAAVDSEYPEVMNSIAQVLCRQHANLHPQKIIFTLAQQIRITPEEYESGKRPLDAEMVKQEDLPALVCVTQK